MERNSIYSFWAYTDFNPLTLSVSAPFMLEDINEIVLYVKGAWAFTGSGLSETYWAAESQNGEALPMYIYASTGGQITNKEQQLWAIREKSNSFFNTTNIIDVGRKEIEYVMSSTNSLVGEGQISSIVFKSGMPDFQLRFNTYPIIEPFVR